MNKRDEFGRCKGHPACANCNCRMLFNQLECMKVDLEMTNGTLNITTNDLDETLVELGEMKIALEEEISLAASCDRALANMALVVHYELNNTKEEVATMKFRIHLIIFVLWCLVMFILWNELATKA